MVAYYDRRAPEFDDWWEGTGWFEGRDRPGFKEELLELTRVVQALAPARVLDLGCGTGFVTRQLRGPLVVGLDPSPSMLRRARGRLPEVPFVQGNGSSLPFAQGSLDRVFTSHVYGHVLHEDRERFLAEARRVGRELVVVDAGPRGGGPREEWQERRLRDGSRHRVYKRFFTASGLAQELGEGHVLHDGVWFVAVRSGPDPEYP
jgi:demethylmenaquinone methyltransferase/2-methoxy-6-polyprenyl-1,4-benzoquinol methylase